MQPGAPLCPRDCLRARQARRRERGPLGARQPGRAVAPALLAPAAVGAAAVPAGPARGAGRPAARRRGHA
eukprot:357323-Chlamydomonas_euryale.AAC.1